MNEVILKEKVFCKYCKEEVDDTNLSICNNCFDKALDEKLNEEIYQHYQN
jgi:hypothetical protein